MDHSPRFLALVDEALTRVPEVAPDALSGLDDAVLIDVREQSEHAAGRIPGAVHLGKGVIERDIERLVPDPSTTLVLYCGGGYRSALAADALRAMGYTDARSLAGGARRWKAEGRPWEQES